MPKGYRMADFDFEKLAVVTKQFQYIVDVNNRSELIFEKGLYLGSDEAFLEYYESGAGPEERVQDVKLTYEFSEADLIQGEAGLADSELIVKKAQLVDAVFADPDMQEKWSHLLSRDAERKPQGRPVVSDDGLMYVVRAQDAKMDYLLDGDYCYKHTGYNTTARSIGRQIEQIEEGESPRDWGEVSLRKAIEHGVTMAIAHGLPKQVVLYALKQGELFESTNAGEWHYHGKPKMQGRVLCEISEEGEIKASGRRINAKPPSLTHSLAL